ncbi:MAG: hypothetical protein ISR65_17375 [Bacteriovoracaceae bacterium]|nr:hypothetical protein [Bacteriovoracaceae bacterium]
MKIIKKFICYGLVLLIFSIGLFGCGFLNDEQIAGQDVYSEFSSTCDIEPNVWARLFTSDIKQQIKCLEKSFSQFSQYVATTDSEAISEQELGIFIKRFFKNNSDSIIGAIELLLRANTMVLSDKVAQLSTPNIEHLSKLLVTINQNAMVIYQTLKTANDENFWESSKEMKQAISNICNTTLEVISKTNQVDTTLDLQVFFDELTTSLKKFNPQFHIKDGILDALFFLKKLFIGGQEHTVTLFELKEILTKAPDVVSTIFDLYFVSKKSFNNDTDKLLSYYLKKINLIQSQLLQTSRSHNDAIFTTADIVTTLNKITNNKYNIHTYKSTIEIVKKKLLGGNQAVYTITDIHSILQYIKEYTEVTLFSSITYDHFLPQMSDPAPIGSLAFSNLPLYKSFTKDRLITLKKDFVDTVKTTRLYRDKSGIQFFTKDPIRTKHGLQQAVQIKWVMQKLLQAYGHRNSACSNAPYVINIEEVNSFLHDFKPLLQAFRLWTKNPKTFASNTLLLADLFQMNSNGNNTLNIQEITQYSSLVLTAIKTAKNLTEKLKNYCRFGTDEQDPLFDVACYRKFFFDILFNELELTKYFSNLYNYTQNTSIEEQHQFLSDIERFARQNADENIPVSIRNLSLIIGAILNIETVMIRFDKNKNNVLEPAETKFAFPVYKDVITKIAGFGSDPESKRKSAHYAYPIYLYVVEKMKRPMPFLGFHFSFLWYQMASDQQVFAGRKNVAGILYYLVKEKNQQIMAQD